VQFSALGLPLTPSDTLGRTGRSKKLPELISKLLISEEAPRTQLSPKLKGKMAVKLVTKWLEKSKPMTNF